MNKESGKKKLEDRKTEKKKKHKTTKTRNGWSKSKYLKTGESKRPQAALLKAIGIVTNKRHCKDRQQSWVKNCQNNRGLNKENCKGCEREATSSEKSFPSNGEKTHAWRKYSACMPEFHFNYRELNCWFVLMMDGRTSISFVFTLLLEYCVPQILLKIIMKQWPERSSAHFMLAVVLQRSYWRQKLYLTWELPSVFTWEKLLESMLTTAREHCSGKHFP